MAVAGRRPKTNEQKKAIGETRPSRRTAENVLDFPIESTPPSAPKWLKKDGKELWNTITPALFAQRALTSADTFALGHLCQLHQEMVQDIRKGIRPTAADRSQFRMYCSEFGMTPSSRTRIGINPESKKDNPFTRNGEKAKN